MKKTKIVLMIFGALFLFLFIFTFKDNKSKKNMISTNQLIHLKVDYSAKSLESLVADSTIIIEAKVSNNQTEINKSDITFTLTDVKVSEVLKGSGISKNDTITLLQTNSYEDPIVEKGSKKILFLDKYEGPITDDAYICKGLYQGNYTLNEDNTLSSSGDFKDNIIKEITQKSKDEFRKDISKFK